MEDGAAKKKKLQFYYMNPERDSVCFARADITGTGE